MSLTLPTSNLQESKLKRRAQKKSDTIKDEDHQIQEIQSVSSSTATLPLAPLTSSITNEKDKTVDDTHQKPHKVLRFHDRLRSKQSVNYSKVDADSIWYSSTEILELREEEHAVHCKLSLGYFRACRDASLLNVEGLLTGKERLDMA